MMCLMEPSYTGFQARMLMMRSDLLESKWGATRRSNVLKTPELVVVWMPCEYLPLVRLL